MFGRPYLKSFVIGGFAIIISSLLFSCTPEAVEKEFFQSQHRDERFFGMWANLDQFSKQETGVVVEYTASGELFYTNDGERGGRIFYYYTKENILYVLTLGSGFKVSSRIHEFEYQFLEEDSLLILQPIDSKEKTVRRRMRPVDHSLESTTPRKPQ